MDPRTGGVTMSRVKVTFRRYYGVGKRLYRPGQVAEVDEALAQRLESTKPPFAVRVEEKPKKAAEAPKAKDATGK